MIARNLDNSVVIATQVIVAKTWSERTVGLLSRSHMNPGDGLWILPCRGVHTFGMRFAIDVLALDPDGTVVDVASDLKPWRVRLPRRGALSVLELPSGTLMASRTVIGHRISIESV